MGTVVCGLSLLGAGNVSAVSITLSTPNKLEVSVIPSAEGTFAKSKAENISVTSDAYAGYILKISGNDDNTLKSGENKLESFEGISGIAETAFDSAAYNNKWGYKPSKKNGVENTKFFPGPKLSGDIIDITKSANPNINNYTVELGVRVDNSQAAGIYTGTFIISAVANDLTYTITYDKNAEDATNEPTKQASSAPEGTPITISEAPKRDKYVFMGWCDQQTDDETCDGNVYQPNDTYKLKNADNTLNLRAMWVSVMQNWDGCATLSEHQTATLIDIRDNNTYTVAKLRDGKCWMTQNLRLGDDQLADRTLTPTTTDIADDKTFVIPASNIAGFNVVDEAFIYIDPGIETGHTEYGGYYSWFAATAGTGTSSTPDGTNAESSICAKDWHLPSEDELVTMTDMYDGYDEAIKPPLNFVTSGADRAGVVSDFGIKGMWWSSTSAITSGCSGVNPCSRLLAAFSHEFSNAPNHFGKSNGRIEYGFSVRCIHN